MVQGEWLDEEENMTPEPMEWPQELQKVAWERSQKATPGPWRWNGGILNQSQNEHENIIWPQNSLHRGTKQELIGACGEHSEIDAAYNMAFIEASRTDLPAAFTHIAFQDERLRLVTESRDKYCRDLNTKEEVEEAQDADIERLRAALRDARELLTCEGDADEDTAMIIRIDDALAPAPSVPESVPAKAEVES